MKRKLIFALLGTIFSLAACATPFYSAQEIRGQIVDGETWQPIEGAVVVAQWVLFHGGIGHGGHKSRLHIYETVTDKDGRYFIPEWGPKPHPPMTELVNRDPEILIFKSGYEPKAVQNSNMENTESVRVSEWDGKVIKLKGVSNQENLEGYASRLNSFYSSLVEDMRNDHEWKKYRKMTTAIYKEYRLLKAKGMRVYRPSIPYVDEFIDP